MQNKIEIQKKPHARSEFIEVEPNVHLHVTDCGEGKPIVLIPGWPLSDEMYEYQYSYLMKHNLRVIGITQRGFGLSDKPYGEYNYDIFAHDILQVLNTLGITDAVLGGFSMGGAVAIRFVAKYNTNQVSKLALFGAAAPIWTLRGDFPYNLTSSEVDALIELCNNDRPMLVANFIKIFSSTEGALSEGKRTWIANQSMNASLYATLHSLMALRDTDLRPDIEKINIPTIIMHGRNDKICSFDLAEQLNKTIANSCLVDFENSGHSLFLEETLKFNTEIVRFANDNIAECEQSTFKAPY